jgi:hypothetical protein
LIKKADDRSLDTKKADPVGASPSATIDEAKVSEMVRNEANAILGETYKSNENRAKRLFLTKYSEYLDDAQWADMISRYNSKNGKASVEDILEDFEDAVLLHKRSTGKLDEHLKRESERNRREGRIEGQMDSGRDGSSAGDRNGLGKGSGSFTSQKVDEMARAMHVDPAKAKKIDPGKDNVIDVISK